MKELCDRGEERGEGGEGGLWERFVVDGDTSESGTERGW
jgi:hypothetical protein